MLGDHEQVLGARVSFRQSLHSHGMDSVSHREDNTMDGRSEVPGTKNVPESMLEQHLLGLPFERLYLYPRHRREPLVDEMSITPPKRCAEIYGSPRGVLVYSCHRTHKD